MCSDYDDDPIPSPPHCTRGSRVGAPTSTALSAAKPVDEKKEGTSPSSNLSPVLNEREMYLRSFPHFQSPLTFFSLSSPHFLRPRLISFFPYYPNETYVFPTNFLCRSNQNAM